MNLIYVWLSKDQSGHECMVSIDNMPLITDCKTTAQNLEKYILVLRENNPEVSFNLATFVKSTVN